MGKYKVTSSSLNVRSGPGTNYNKVDTLGNNSVVEVSSISNGWANIGVNKYCSASYLTQVNEQGSTYNVVTGSVAKSVEGQPVYFLQGDSRWGSIMFSIVNSRAQTIKTSGCGPTSASMIINEYADKAFSPKESCELAKSLGYRTANSGTSWGFFKALAVKYGFEFLQTGYVAEAQNFLKTKPRSLVVCSMGRGNWTSAGHYILLYKVENGTTVYINDPASTAGNRVKNTLALLKSQCAQYFCFSYPDSAENAAKWADKTNVVDIASTKFAIECEGKTNVYNTPSTSGGSASIVGTIDNSTIVTATKKAGDWFYCANGTVSGYIPASYLIDPTLLSIHSQTSIECLEALDKLIAEGFISDRDYWINSAYDLDYTADLIIKIAASNLEPISSDKFDVKTTELAIDYLADIKILSSPKYWKENYTKLNNVNYLLVKAANRIIV